MVGNSWQRILPVVSLTSATGDLELVCEIYVRQLRNFVLTLNNKVVTYSVLRKQNSDVCTCTVYKNLTFIPSTCTLSKYTRNLWSCLRPGLRTCTIFLLSTQTLKGNPYVCLRGRLRSMVNKGLREEKKTSLLPKDVPFFPRWCWSKVHAVVLSEFVFLFQYLKFKNILMSSVTQCQGFWLWYKGSPVGNSL